MRRYLAHYQHNIIWKGGNLVNNALEKNELNRSDEFDMFYEYKKSKDSRLRDKIFEKFIHIPHSVSKRYSLKSPDYDDLYQSACLGLLNAINAFNPEYNVKFYTYATTCVLNEVRKYFKEKGNFIKIPQRLYHIYYKAQKLKNEVYQTEGRELSLDELCVILEVSHDELECALNWGENKISKSLDQFMHEGEDMIYSDLVAVEDNSLLLVENKMFIENCFKKLTKEEKLFLKYRYYDEKSQLEIAKLMNVSQMKISRMEKKVLFVLKNMYYEH